MGLKTCMNILCGTTSSSEWKTGWSLRSGELAILCDKCGYAFEQRVYCEEFHGDDSGWRQCVTCDKRLHCGCIASWSLIEMLDCGGVKCISCARNLGNKSIFNVGIHGKCNGSGPSSLVENVADLAQLSDFRKSNGSHQPSISLNVDANAALSIMKQEELLLPLGKFGGTHGSNIGQPPMGLFQKSRLDMSTINMQGKDRYDTITHPNLNMSLGIPTGNLHSISGVVVDQRDQRKMPSAWNQAISSHHLLSTPPKLSLSPVNDTNGSVMPSTRIARPPVEGRGRHQLLPRYWPRITDQELLQISGDANCTIVPLFEKVLSASDAGRIGRLVLPKACAEAYFPPISQPEGIPIKIQDVKGKEWVFQFRFWPNNNSRMYVLEGVTPCIQSMQLQAGDTVTFSRIDPEGKLVMGFRKASNSSPMQPLKGSTNLHVNAVPIQSEEGLLPTSTLMPERKKSRNLGPNSKRLLIDSQDALALKMTWEEVQGLLRPPQTAKRSIVIIEDYEFEEYDEPPVFGKSSIFTARSSGVIEQWAQCDTCSKWRRLPADILLPPKWTCADNAWDQSRCFCSAPNELAPKDLENFLQQSKYFKKKRLAMAGRMINEKEPSSLDALANAAILGDNSNDPGSLPVATTTKHPRHRPGCSCIVCIQPPSGKGKHKSTCTCTVCMTVKRRFQTLMKRKKKRQFEQDLEDALKNPKKPSLGNKKEHDELVEAENMTKTCADNHPRRSDDDLQVGPSQHHDGMLTESGKGLDLNCQPEREEELRAQPNHQGSLSGLLQLASLPLEAYMKQNGLMNLKSEQPGGSGSQVGQTAGETEGQPDPVEDHPMNQQEVSCGDNGSCESDNKKQTVDPS